MFPPPPPNISKVSFKLLCAAQHMFLQLTLLLEREMWNQLHTRVHKKHRQSCIVLEEALYLSLAHSHKGTMAKLKTIGHAVC